MPGCDGTGPEKRGPVSKGNMNLPENHEINSVHTMPERMDHRRCRGMHRGCGHKWGHGFIRKMENEGHHIGRHGQGRHGKGCGSGHGQGEWCHESREIQAD